MQALSGRRLDLRRLFFTRLVYNLAAVLGLAQTAAAHWLSVLWGASPVPTPQQALLSLLLVVGNALAVPQVTRLRRFPGPAGRLSRLYVQVGIATLLVGLAIALCWLVFLPARLLLGFEPALEAFRSVSPGLVALVVAAVCWGFTGGQSRVAHTRLRVGIEGLHDDLHGLRLAQISDLHIGNALEGVQLSRMVARVNASGSDLIVLTGDLFDFDPSVLDEGARRLGELDARFGVYAILGNHDVYVGADRVAEALARHAPALRLLRDEIARVPTPAPLYLAGLEDPGRRWFDRRLRYPVLESLARRRPDDGPVLLLAHQPEIFDHAAELGFPLVLAGHTHGGQLALPTPGGHWNLARVMTPLTRGVYRREATTLYVNRGLGVGGPALRINCPREIAVFELRDAARA
jgi:predicted MPP superfamily phosphohydrolase